AGMTTGAAGTTAGAAGAGGQTGGAAGASGGAGTVVHPIVEGSLTFTRTTLHLFNYAEGIGIGDFNKDGAVDVHSGPFWWEGPDFTQKHQLFPPPANNAYTDKTLGDWADYEYDVDGDGWLDSINIMRPGTPSYWYKNPGKPTLDAAISTWTQTTLGTLVMEQSAFTDLTGEGKPELVGAIEGKTGWFDVKPSGPWTFNPIGVTGATVAYAWWHGIGTGDLDGDGKTDLIQDTAWYSRPAAGPRAGAWTSHAQTFKDPTLVGDQGPSQMYGYDVDGDGDQDVITALNAHGYGVAWFENKNGAWIQHVIVGGAGSMATNAGMIAPFSQPHALLVADIDGDGLKDIVTGKSFYAHPPGMGDPDADGTPVFYVFKLVRGAGGAVTFEPHLVDSVEGLGRQFTAGDLNNDGKVDIAVASKHGAFLFFQQ
ncbi:MAG TPA: VCBS repeat-containing protein, partial [Polyangia bacterium]|nr:VCBS repeat-containing protein [Polyangia bacterium]